MTQESIEEKKEMNYENEILGIHAMLLTMNEKLDTNIKKLNILDKNKMNELVKRNFLAVAENEKRLNLKLEAQEIKINMFTATISNLNQQILEYKKISLMSVVGGMKGPSVK